MLRNVIIYTYDPSRYINTFISTSDGPISMFLSVLDSSRLGIQGDVVKDSPKGFLGK